MPEFTMLRRPPRLPEDIEFPEDVIALGNALRSLGYEASPLDIEWAYEQVSEEVHASWLTLDCAETAAKRLLDYLVPVGDRRLTEGYCGCWSCLPTDERNKRMVVCSQCGNKRCPHATDHNNPCTGSNEPGQPGSRFTTSARTGE